MSVEDTVDFLIKIHDSILKKIDSNPKTNSEESTQIQAKFLFSEFTSNNAKTKNSSVENIFVRQLRCFDDCGAKSVEVLRNVFKCPNGMFRIINKINQAETKENLFAAGSYLYENSFELDEESILLYAQPENFKTLKKEIKSVKKIRKNTNAAIISFYS